MSLFFGRQGRDASISSLIPGRSSGAAPATADKALRHSAVWACLRLRADLISTMPVDVYRRRDGVDVELPPPPVLVNPGGARVDMAEWLYSTQMELDRYGNSCGLITAVNGLGLPARIDLFPMAEVSVVVKGGEVAGYRIAGKRYDPEQVWHEKQFTVPGLPIGLNPTAYAAWSLGAYLNAQQFALDWFSNPAPSGTLRNTKKTVPQKEARDMKDRFREATAGRDIFVTGSDWEFEFLSVPASETAFMDQMKYGIADACRFYGVPGDMIDAETSTGSITYANVTQRNLQLLIMNIGPAVARRERALSRLTPKPQFVKLNTDALLRMDPRSVVESLKLEIDARIRTPNEARALRNLPPLTPEQISEIHALFPPKATPPTTQGAPA